MFSVSCSDPHHIHITLLYPHPLISCWLQCKCIHIQIIPIMSSQILCTFVTTTYTNTKICIKHPIWFRNVTLRAGYHISWNFTAKQKQREMLKVDRPEEPVELVNELFRFFLSHIPADNDWILRGCPLGEVWLHWFGWKKFANWEKCSVTKVVTWESYLDSMAWEHFILPKVYLRMQIWQAAIYADPITSCCSGKMRPRTETGLERLPPQSMLLFYKTISTLYLDAAVKELGVQICKPDITIPGIKILRIHYQDWS